MIRGLPFGNLAIVPSGDLAATAELVAQPKKRRRHRFRSAPPSVVTTEYALRSRLAFWEGEKAMESMARVSITKNVLSANNLEITDQPAVEYIAAFAADQRVDALVNCVQLGARVAAFANDRLGAMRIAEKISDSAESAKKLLTGISASTTQHIDQAVKAALGKDGTLSKLLAVQLDDLQRDLEVKLDPEKATSVTARIRDAVKKDVAIILEQVRSGLDLSNPESPLGILQTDVRAKLGALDEKVTQLVTQAAVKSAVGVERLRGTQKGIAFEDAVHAALGEICRHRQDQVERTASEAGLNGRSKHGDFVIELNTREARGPGLFIAVEAKNDQTKHRDLLRELDKAMDNRNAPFGIGISTSKGLLPFGSPPIEFSADNKILVRIDDYDAETGGFDSICLEVALNVARYVCITTRDAQPCSLDAALLDGNIVQAINALGRLSELKKNLTSITTTAKQAHALVDAIRDEIREALETIRDAVENAIDGASSTAPQLKSA